MRFTRKDADKLAEIMIKNPNDEFRLMSDGALYKEDRASLEQGRDLFVGIKRLGKLPNWLNKEDDLRVLWNGVLATFLEDERFEKLKYKTHLSNYLYQAINKPLRLIKGRVVKPSGNEEIDLIIRKGSHWEYRSRKPIQIETNVNNSQQILISTDGTGYITAILPKKVEKDELLILLDRVWEKAEDHPKVKIVGDKKEREDYIEENYSQYEEEYRGIVELFSEMRQLWDWKVKEDGFYMGTLDDEVLKVLNNKTREFNERKSKERPLGKIKSIEHILIRENNRINDIHEDVIETTVYL